MNYFQAHVEAFVSVYEVRKLTKIRKTLLKAYQLCYKQSFSYFRKFSYFVDRNKSFNMSLKIIHTKNLRWIDIVGPEDSDLTYLKEHFKFHPLDFEDIITPSIRTKIDEYPAYHFIVLLFPYYSKENNEIRSVEVDFLIGPDYVITIHNGKMKTLEKLSELKKNIIIYRRIVKMHRYVLNKILHSSNDYLKFKDHKTYFQDLIEYGENIWNVLSSDKESVESFEETNQSLGTHRINDILQVLTVLSVVLAALNLITNILVFMDRTNIEENYGLSNNLYLISFITGFMFVVTITMLYYFRKRRWL